MKDRTKPPIIRRRGRLIRSIGWAALLSALLFGVGGACQKSRPSTDSRDKASTSVLPPVMVGERGSKTNRGIARQDQPVPTLYSRLMTHDEWLALRSSGATFEVAILRENPETGEVWMADIAKEEDWEITLLSVEESLYEWAKEAHTVPYYRRHFDVDFSAHVPDLLATVRNSDLFALNLPCEGCLYLTDTPEKVMSDICYPPDQSLPGTPALFTISIGVEETPNHFNGRTFCLRAADVSPPDRAAFLSLWNSIHQAFEGWETNYYIRQITDTSLGYTRKLFENKKDNMCDIEEYRSYGEPDDPGVHTVLCTPGQPFP